MLKFIYANPANRVLPATAFMDSVAVYFLEFYECQFLIFLILFRYFLFFVLHSRCSWLVATPQLQSVYYLFLSYLIPSYYCVVL